jgi:hypothetical protein
VQAADCLAEAIAGRIVRGDEIPSPSKPKPGQHVISVPLYLAPKVALYLAIRERQIPNTERPSLHQTDPPPEQPNTSTSQTGLWIIAPQPAERH